MGYNRSGVRRTKRLKRAHKPEVRLAAKAQAESVPPAEAKGASGQAKSRRPPPSERCEPRLTPADAATPAG